MTQRTKTQLQNDIVEIAARAFERGYNFTVADAFALGYMCAKHDVERLKDNQEKVVEACKEYDKTDDLGLMDTIGETLIDLEIISNEKKEL